jgi:glycosyltransferase involved in cell wall biosynthesis
MKNRRILLLAPFPPPVGGDTVMALNLRESRYWEKHAIIVDSIDTSPGGTVRLPERRIAAVDVARGLRILSRVIRKIPGTDTIVLWANSRFICTIGLPVILHAVVMGKPIVVKPFGAFLAKRIAGYPRLWRSLVTGILRKARYILPETRAIERELIDETGFEKSRIVCFPNFLPDESFQESYEKKVFSGKCVFAGQIKREKGVFDIITALSGRNDLSCDFYGPLVERDEREFHELVSKHDNLSYRGLIKPEFVAGTIARYDVLLLPSYHVGEGYPAVVLQAFAGGVPVIASSWKSIPEIVEDGVRGLLVPPESPDAIAKALDLLASDGRLYDSIAANAFTYVGAFSERATVEDILISKIIDSL